jgi:hypothetical protein
LATSGLVASSLLISAHLLLRSNPEWAYEHITGHHLPPGIHATAYDWKFNDNLFHVGHYWLLTGTDPDFRKLAAAVHLAESTEDARWALPGNGLSAGHSRDSVATGFEGDQARNNWLWVFDGSTQALYEYN